MAMGKKTYQFYPEYQFNGWVLNAIRILVSIIACVLCFFIILPLAVLILATRWIVKKVYQLLLYFKK